MKRKQPPQTTEQPPDNHHEDDISSTSFTSKSDICDQLLHRYGKSSAAQHRHLCATAAATRSIIESESLPLTPLSYFAATIEALSQVTERELDVDAVAALSSLFAIVLSVVKEGEIAKGRASEAASVVVGVVEGVNDKVSGSSVRSLVKCLGVLLGFCDWEDWEKVELGFETLLKYSIDKRPKVRKCSQDCVVMVFKSSRSAARKKASKSVLSLFKTYIPSAKKLTSSKSADGSKGHILSKPEYLEVLHLLNVLKHIIPYLSVKVRSKAFSELRKLMKSKFSALTRHIFDFILVALPYLDTDDMTAEATKMLMILSSYVSSKKNPVDTILSAASLLEKLLGKLHTSEAAKDSGEISLIFGSIAGLLTSEATASQASEILKELVDRHIIRRDLTSMERQAVKDEVVFSLESTSIKSICNVLLDVLKACNGIPNEHILEVVSLLFLKIGEASDDYMGGIVLKLASFMTDASGDIADTKYIQECFGSAVVAMGPEKILTMLPVSFSAKDLTCANIWLLPILKDHVAGSSLAFFMEHFVPLAESIQLACEKVKKAVIREDLQAYAHGCWKLLPAFCRYPNDMYKNFGSLAKLLIPLIKRDSFLLQDIAIALQGLVNQNRSVLSSDQGAGEVNILPDIRAIKYNAIELRTKLLYSRKIAARNLSVLASCSEELLQSLANVLFELPPEKRIYIKDTIRCLASIADSSVAKKILVSSFERFDLPTGGSIVKREATSSTGGNSAERCLILELASSFVGAPGNDLIELIYNFIGECLQEADDDIVKEAYVTLNKVLEDSSQFCSSKFVDLMELLINLDSPFDITSRKCRFSCFKTLLVHSMERAMDGDSTYAFKMRDEIILALKDSNEEGRKVAYDILQEISSTLKSSSPAIPDGPYHKFIKLIMGSLAVSSPQIRSSAVSALSLVIYNDSDVCRLIPDLLPSVLNLLYARAVEIIKAVLGFLKVLVLNLEVKELTNLLPKIVKEGLLQWSSGSEIFSSKVTVILEILMRRCGSAEVTSVVPHKYKDFVQNVSENRRVKRSLKEGLSSEKEKSSKPDPRRLHKKKHKEMPNDSGEPQERRNEDSRKSAAGSVKELPNDSNEPRSRKLSKWKGNAFRSKRRKLDNDRQGVEWTRGSKKK